MSLGDEVCAGMVWEIHQSGSDRGWGLWAKHGGYSSMGRVKLGELDQSGQSIFNWDQVSRLDIAQMAPRRLNQDTGCSMLNRSRDCER